MSGFIDRIFGSKVETDLVRAGLESRISFEFSQIDRTLLSAYLQSDQIQQMVPFQQKMLSLSVETKIHISEEVSLLNEYLDLIKTIKGKGFYLQFDTAADDESGLIEPLILFPLIQNVVKNGYASMEKYPIKIKIRVSGDTIQLEVSNRVNHHIANQADDELIRLYRQRLFMNYPNEHELFMNSNAHTFKATLLLKYAY